MLLERYLEQLAAETMQRALGLDTLPQALLRATADAKFGDYQVNGAMALAKRLQRDPRALAAPIAEALAQQDAIKTAQVAGPGFVNLTLDDEWIAARLTDALADERLGVDEVAQPQTVVVDFSSPNIAKQMHVGHLRSTILGHALIQLSRFVGHHVIGDNHIGDWGTQYGLLLVGMRRWGNEDALNNDAIVELERVYKLASAAAKESQTFADEARAELAKLQAGDEENLRLWKRFVQTTRATLEQIYARLGVTFDTWLGESAYHEALPGVVETLLQRGIAREDNGAVCVFFNEINEADIAGALPHSIPKKLRKRKEPLIVRKKDGAFLYSTTDLATAYHRRDAFGAQRSAYVVDSRQSLHFEQVFAVARLLGIDTQLDHVGFGTILGDDGTPIKTRDGKAITLKALLDEAEQRTEQLINEKSKEGVLRIGPDQLNEARRVIGLGAVKYGDLMQNRLTDYKFDWEKMIALSGNAAPYLQYNYARTRSVFREGNIAWDGYHAALCTEHPAERALARVLLRFGDTVHRAAHSYQPHLVCEYLYTLARQFSRFWRDCPVLNSQAETRASRLALVALCGRQLQLGLKLLGIGVLDKM